tara:strand:- start:81 stop:542 length:462 start_codon:yes stop_codon:yes gene_type:complete
MDSIIIIALFLMSIIAYVGMINVIYFLAPNKKWTEFPKKCNIKTKCTRVAESNTRGYGLKPIELEYSIEHVQKEIIKIIETNPRMKIINYSSGFIHATDFTPFFRFYDDVAIKIFEENDKAVVWLQSQSRLGYYDFQVNEKRIQKLHQIISSL